MHARGVCMGGMHGRGVCVAGGMNGRGECMAGGHAWQGGMCGREVVCAGGVHAMHAHHCLPLPPPADTTATAYGQ